MRLRLHDPGRRRALLVIAVVAFLVAACASRPANPDLAAAVEFVADDLAGQLGIFRRNSTLVIDPLLDGPSGQQTAATQRVEYQLKSALARAASPIRILTFDGKGAERADLVATGTLSPIERGTRYRLSVAVSDPESGLVVAQSAVLFQQPGLDLAPTPFYEDSPSLVRDRSVDGYVRTSETPAGQPADALYIEQLPTSALLAEALEAYNEGRWEDARARYEAAANRQDGQQLRTFNGLYLTNKRLENQEAAEEAFRRVVELGLATNNLAVKLLFRPGSTEYWPDPKVSGAYPMWLRQIARASAKADICMEIVGHTSRSGSPAFNLHLSRERAATVRAQLARYEPELRRRSRVVGVGFEENIVGTGADDVTDAIDRRAEFRVVPCGDRGSR